MSYQYTMDTSKTYARLRLRWEDRTRTLLASASPVVPVLWAGLFDYDDNSVIRDDALELLRAETTVALARQRARDLMAALPEGHPRLTESAGLLPHVKGACPATSTAGISIGSISANRSTITRPVLAS